MKFYVLKHPIKGYLRSKKYYTCSWTDDIEKAKKWSYKSHPKSCQTQTGRLILKECQIEEIQYWIGKNIE